MRLFRNILPICAALLLLLSCETDPGLCTIEHPHKSYFAIRYDWTDVEESYIPDSMVVFVERLVMRWNSSYMLSRKTYRGSYLFNDLTQQNAADEPEETPDGTDAPEELPEENEPGGNEPGEGGNDSPAEDGDEGDNNVVDETPEENEAEGGIDVDIYGIRKRQDDAPLDHATMAVKPGQYALITFSRNVSEFNYKGIDDYAIDRYDPMSFDSIYVEYKSYKKDDENLRRYLSSWTDFNPYSDYVQSNPQPFLYQVADLMLLKDGEEKNVTFKPKPIMQHITLNFNIEKVMDEAHRFAIDSIHVEISGIPYRFYLTRDELDIRKTYKMLLYPMVYSEDTYTNTSLTYSASFNATGIVPAISQDVALGPGIVIAKVYLHSQAHPERRIQPVNARINLYNTIVRDPLIRMNDENTAGVLVGDRRVINVDAVLRIDGSTVIESEDEVGQDNWKICKGGFIVDI